MKYRLLPLCSLLLAAALPAAAADVFVEAGVGASDANADCAGTSSCDNRGRLLRASVGALFTPHVGVEILAADFGRFGATAPLPGLGEAQVSGRVRSVGAGATLRLPLGSAFALTGRLGVASNRTTLEGSIVGDDEVNRESQRHTAPYAGIGASYRLTPALALTLQLDGTQARFDDEKTRVLAVGAGLRYAF